MGDCGRETVRYNSNVSLSKKSIGIHRYVDLELFLHCNPSTGTKERTQGFSRPCG